MKKIILALALILVAIAYAGGKAPQYRSMRVHGMGNAFVAVADNKDALYYNPAGLNLINRFGDFKRNPDMGYMPSNEGSLRILAINLELPVGDMNRALNLCGNRSEFWDAVWFNFNQFRDIEWCQDIRDAYDNNNLTSKDDEISAFDKTPILKIRPQVTFLEYATHNFGFSMWTNTSTISPYVDMGVILPFPGYDTITIDVALQTAIAFSPVEKWSVGAGIKAVQRRVKHGNEFKLSVDDPMNTDQYEDAVEDAIDDLVDDLTDFKEFLRPEDLIKFGKYNFALDLGLLYQIHREVRLGMSLRDFYFSKLEGESITPNFSLGAMTSPMILQSNSWFERKVNIAVDYVDILNVKSGMFFSHLNFGAEIEQVLIPSPTQDFSFWPRFGFGVLGGAIGGGIGYLIGSGFKGPDVGPFFLGSLIGIGLGFTAGSDFGFGNDLVKVAAGGGFEGGYWAATLAAKVSLLEVRYSSWAEEAGLRTGQKENRYHMIHVLNGF
jgi:hypothetical protein